jgi:putative transposase
MTFGLSERRSCALAGIGRSSFRHRSACTKDTDLLGLIRKLAKKNPRYGYRRIWALLRRTDEAVNRKRVWRLWKKAGLTLKRRPSRKRRKGCRVEGPLQAAYPRHVVTYDFMFVRTVDGRLLKILTVVDEFTRECLGIVVRTRITAVDVIRILRRLFDRQGWPEFLRSDNGGEFVAEVLERWLLGRNVKAHHIDPASPWQNPFGESFNDKFRTECLNLEPLLDANEGQRIAQAYRRHYNQQRPHSSLRYRTPSEVYQDWERTRMELFLSPAPSSLRSSRGAGGREEKTMVRIEER